MMSQMWEVMLFLALVLSVSCGVTKPKPVLYQFPEKQPANTLIGSLATVQEMPDTGRLYKLEVGSPYLRVDNNTGDIYTTEIPIDRETLTGCHGDVCFLDFEVSVTDTVKDVDSDPRLITGQIEVIPTLFIPENTQLGTLFSIPMATNMDSRDNSMVYYSLRPRLDDLFDLQVTDELLPKLVITGILDREKKDSYDLNIQVLDGGRPARVSSTLLRVTVTDENDNAPVFEKDLYEVELLENSPLGYSVLQVRANDADAGTNGEIDYSLYHESGNVTSLLHIDPSTGVIYFDGLVDCEEGKFFKWFYVVAKDRGLDPKRSQARVMINLKDVNDNAPAIEIQGVDPIKYEYGVVSVPEYAEIGTQVASVQVSDRDEGNNTKVTCMVAGDVPFYLQLVSESTNDRTRKYFLYTTAVLDYERVRDYRVEIVAVDTGNPVLSSTNSLKVQVIDMNDNTPRFSPEILEVGFPEGNQPGDEVLVVMATDADSGTNAELTYSIIEPSASRLFEIDTNTGEVRVKTMLDREEIDRYEFHVAAADKGLPSLTGTATVMINVVDRNDNDPWI